MKTRREPKRLTRRGNALNWRIELINPHPVIHDPIDAGLMLSPPSSTDVDQTSGIRTPAAMSISAIMA